MQEIFKKLNRENQPEKTEIEFETNPHRIIGASMTKEHRLLCFETQQTEPLYIDFIPYNGTTDTIFLIPSGHLLYLPNSTTHFHCINVPYSCINDFELSWFYIYKYESNKSIKFDNQNIKLYLTKNLTQFINSSVNELKSNSSLNLYKAKQLCEIIENTTFTHNFSVTKISQNLCITQPTL